jgi:hypothetical protein
VSALLFINHVETLSYDLKKATRMLQNVVILVLIALATSFYGGAADLRYVGHR